VFKGFPGFLLIVVLAVLGWLAFPVSLWLLGAVALQWMVRSWADRLEGARLSGRRGLIRAAAEITARSMSGALAYVAFGILLVTLAQAALWVGAQAIEPSTVRQTEEFLSWCLQSISRLLDFDVLAFGVLLLLVVTLLRPRSPLMTAFLRLRMLLTRMAYVLLGATSFTFFGALDLHRLDPEWRAAERYLARSTLAAIEGHSRDIAAAAWTESEVRRLAGDKKQEFSQFFDAARKSPNSIHIVKAAATEFAKKAPAVKPKAPMLGTEGVISDRVVTYLRDERPSLHVSDQPALKDLRATNQTLTARELRLRAVRTAAIELAAEAFAELAPKTEKALINAFVQELSSSLSKGALREIVPSRVADVASAREWVKVNLTGSTAVERGVLTHAWAFYPSSLERVPVGGGIRASEAVALALVSRLNAEAVARQRLSSAIRTPGVVYSPPVSSVRVPTTSGVRVRFRF
jgi:hypothetical protein